jgi:nucleoside-diphosphate-sugar epimerase
VKSWDNESVVVTGAAGFLGSHLCQTLASNGARVVALDNVETGSSANLESLNGGIQIISCDITKKDDLQSYIRDSQTVFHLAAIASPRACKANFDLAFDVNVVGTKNILSACENGQRVIFMSSASVYGEPAYVPIDEDHPLDGKDPYAATKIMAENLCRNYYQSYGVSVIIVRNFNAFGPRQSPEYIVPTLITQALNDNRIEIWSVKPTRDLMYVDNTIEALLRIAGSDELGGQVVNVGSGEEIQIGVLAEKVAQICGGVPLVDLNKDVIGSPRLVCDNAKLKETTGWKITVAFEEGLQRTTDWFRKHYTG